MTKEQALERTRALRNQADPEWHEYLDFVENIIRISVERKPYKIKFGLSSVGICMKCGTNFKSKQNYCSYCGQKQDWGGQDD